MMVTWQVIRRTRRLMALTIAILAGVLAMGGAVAAHAQSMDSASCASAGLLTRDGLPRRALALLATLPGPTTDPSCARAEDAAQTAVQDSVVLSQNASSFATAKDWTKAAEASTAALALDRENAAATALQSQARKMTDDDQEAREKSKSWFEQLGAQWKVLLDEQLMPLGALLLPFLGVLLLLVILARLIVLVIREWPEPNPPTLRSDEPDWFRPLMLLGGILSAAGASFMASAALSDTYSSPVSVPTMWCALAVTVLASAPVAAAARQVRGRLSGRGKAIPSWWLAVVGAVAVGLALLGVVVRLLEGVDVSPRTELVWALGLAGLMAVQGVCLLAWWLATRIRLDVKATDAEVGKLAAMLSELGAEKPKGLEVPRGADVTALDGALAALPENPVLKVLKDILRSISGVTPWTATIEGDAKTRVVTVVRNGRTVGSAIIDPELMGLVPTQGASDDAAALMKASGATEAPDHTLKMAAAFVLMTMSEAHPAIRQGLAGAVAWKSLGYHYVATTMTPGGAPAQQQLLARALDEDPENRAARLAFRHAVDRQSVQCQPLSQYATFLESFIVDLQARHAQFDTETLKLRAMYTRAVIEVNAIYAHESGEHGPGPDVVEGKCTFDRAAHQAAARTALDDLGKLVPTRGDAAPNDRLKTFKNQFRDDVSGLRLLAGLDRKDPTPSSPTGMYNLGCTYASRGDIPWPEKAVSAPESSTSREAGRTEDEKAGRWLDLACQDPENKEWLAKDPQLFGFRQRHTYRTAYLADPRTDFFTLSTVEPLAKQLRSAGYGDVSLIAEASPVTLGSILPADPTISSQLVELAQLRLGLGRFTPPEDPEPDPMLAQVREWLTAQQAAASPLSANDPWPLAWVLDLLSQRGQYTSPPSAAPQPEPRPAANSLERWAIEILDELTSRGLARRASLVHLASGEGTALAGEVVKALMKTHKPMPAADLAAYEAGLVQDLATWMRSPY